jgi:hypothetical protein
MKFHLLSISSSLLLGAGLSAIQPGNFLLGWLLFSFLFLLSFYVLRFTFFWAVAPSKVQRSTFNLQLLLTIAFLLRLALGAALYVALPVDGNPNEQNRAGYIFFDSFRRDAQAWDLAQSDQPILNAFSKKFYTDQYGGLLAFSALAYRYLSPDAHRPLLIVLFAALAAALGVAFLWKAAARQWGESVAAPAAWIFALYPESILLGSAQMREPFLMLFTAMALWGFVEWRASGLDAAEKRRLLDQRSAILWLVLGFAGMLLVSPGVALAMLVVLGGWMWVRREHGRVSWIALAAAGLVFLAGLYLLAWGLTRESFGAGSPLGVIFEWFREAVKWDVYQLERGSGWVQKLFDEMPGALRPLFVAVYGITRPVLPAQFIESTTLTLRLLGIFRSIGWYALVPLLFYAPFAVWRTQPGQNRRLWAWLTTSVWVWIVIASLRGGADEWDNPRYRAILLVWQALVAGYAWAWSRERRDAWLGRWVVLEVVFLAVFTQWYLSRYYHIGGQMPFGWMVALLLGAGGVILLGGWWWDRRRARRA